MITDEQLKELTRLFPDKDKLLLSEESQLIYAVKRFFTEDCIPPEVVCVANEINDIKK